MNDKVLKDKIANLYKDELPIPDAFQESVGKLRKIAKYLEESLEPGVTVSVEAGQRVNLGQQYNIVVRVPKVGLQDVLFRAYVPMDGLPVRLDLFDGERPNCSSLDDLEHTLLRFLEEPDVKRRLLEVKREARLPP